MKEHQNKISLPTKLTLHDKLVKFSGPTNKYGENLKYIQKKFLEIM